MEKIFAEGFYLNKLNEKAPSFVLVDQSIHVEKALAWLEANKGLANEKGYINLTGKESQNGKRYFEVNTFKPKQVITGDSLPEDINPADIPF